jgi:phospholipid-binding lipoprotein MlaA
MRVSYSLKRLFFLAIIFAFLVMGCAHSPQRTSSPDQTDVSVRPQTAKAAPESKETSLNLSDASAKSESKSKDDEEYLDDIKDGADAEALTIADPLEPFNRAMYQFNDKLYFWMLKPVAQGYSKAVPESARVSVKNFFSNLGFPVRFLSCLLQVDFSCAATEFGRFGINTIWGIGGLLDPAANKELDLQKQDTDLGLTLAFYGVGHGFYIVWPILGPSSPRDSIDIVGDYFLYPVSYITPWYAWLGVRSYQEVNSTSLKIGDYESLQGAAIDPYIAIRDAYVQYRLKQIKGKKTKPETTTSQTDLKQGDTPER